ncbi:MULTISPECIES: type IV secretion system DotC family protein [unclassified Pseudomonas]|uniref:type IV secretion system DotC family protein n=3 Tax=Pseudomonadota TaxID=1224 RepID=UPI002AB54772|nr:MULTISPECIES: type IV secretion system DotC family protein [unclassified Pseudomonas]MDY7563422.1 type IV secretion system DotC family protein [Pseudomonas sp. AB6]MEA9980005.1 type IV secretion system DotC family protein [Pseudomonas sp. RTS4]MEA9996492.1 type IV secretion system DotC family protein [Pseudomonas sp. AA4]MEB0198162.1 type IV secretion system DotC family protein [Pseudomonas sp. 5S4]MEB0213493.1 type IV secretion system DotC family protein [Pseudomonas sp. AB6]
MKKSLLTLVLIQGLMGCVQTPSSTPSDAPPALDSYLSTTRPASADVSDTRRQLLEEAGRTVGFRGGKAQRAWELRQALEKRFGRLELMYDFRTLISSEGWLPPVVDEAVDVAHITPGQIHLASHVYEIIAPERFVSNPPSWRSWLLAGLATMPTDGPESSVLPENVVQKGLWQAAIRQGWDEGRISADHTLEANFNRLKRDYTGMLLYSFVLREGLMTKPVVTDQQQTVTGDRQKLTTGDRVRTLKENAGFIPDKTQWRPVIRRAQP